MNPIFKLWSAWAVLALAGMYFFAFVPPVYAFSSAALSGGQCAVVMNANAQGGLAVRSEPGTAAGVLLRLSD